LLVSTAVAALILAALLPLVTFLVPTSAPGVHQALIAIPLIFGAAAITTRLGFSACVRHGVLECRRLAVIQPAGAGPTPAAVRDWLSGHGYRVVLDLRDARMLGTPDGVRQLLDARIDTVVLTDTHVPDSVRQRCQGVGIAVMDEAEFVESRQTRVDLERLPSDWLASAKAMREGVVARALRRTMDIALGVALIALTLPLLILAALAIKLDSPGPIFYCQERVGQGGRVFRLFKFRSMRVDAEAAGAPVWASKADPRVTRVGRLLRLTRIDEIPQVLNVLRGEMAFVGPRPERPGFVSELAKAVPHYEDRAVVKPGITGWAQVNYPYGASVEDAWMKLTYDLYYVRHRTIFLDIMILIATVRVVLFQEGSR
jgi:exopolysaccharide biosynthesis polyprenyl glycosylphosphotransferase